MTLFGLIVLIGPLLGPVVGGWLAENIDWSWCFFVNVPVGVALIALLYAGLPKSQHDWHQFVNADWLGIMAFRGPELADRRAGRRPAGKLVRLADDRLAERPRGRGYRHTDRRAVHREASGRAAEPADAIRVMRASFSSCSWSARASTACRIWCRNF